MKVLRAHDYPQAPPRHDFRELRRILIGFFVATAMLFTICIVMVLRARPVQLRKVNPCTCVCR
jgi:hypothetical protein